MPGRDYSNNTNRDNTRRASQGYPERRGYIENDLGLESLGGSLAGSELSQDSNLPPRGGGNNRPNPSGNSRFTRPPSPGTRKPVGGLHPTTTNVR
eukprot:CAMPEP_0119046808 /NCGR_PEP_ID=MMETSP1177-20130426/49035_1 /TAXON_ID=2985 /ORGANISM="Ochromonas sp, Strain CCMP1899" /LENGTH=94 /DNA_ID=CAMNT_0007020485 /DNA_START=25 /DNA_END=306 /DNA_ORIENTATION=-